MQAKRTIVSRLTKLVLLASLGVVLGFSCPCSQAAAVPDLIAGKALIPPPKSCKVLPGVFQGKTPLPFNSLAGKGLQDESVRLSLRDAFELNKDPSAAPVNVGLRLEIGDPKIEDHSPEAYRLRVEQNLITVTGRTADGVLMGLGTLAQLALDGPIPACEIADWPDMRLRATHICYCHVLESMPYNLPNFDALLAQIDRLAAVKQNAVLLELTAMFPFQKHATVSCKIAFTPAQIARLRQRLETQRMEIIPLVQCLGHAYEVLRHDQYAPYRELATHTQQYCPTNPRVIDLYLEFVDEYLAAFPGIKTFHLGGDESRMLGRCPHCAKKVAELGVSRLYVDHVGEVARRHACQGPHPSRLVGHDGAASPGHVPLAQVSGHRLLELRSAPLAEALCGQNFPGSRFSRDHRALGPFRTDRHGAFSLLSQGFDGH